MSRPRKITALGLALGSYLAVFVASTDAPWGLRLLLALAVFASAVTAVTTWARSKFLSLVLTWVTAVCVAAAGSAQIGFQAVADPGPGDYATVLVGGVWFGSIAVIPLLLAGSVAAYLSVPRETRRQDLRDLHS